MNILVVNGGSSSIKASLFRLEGDQDGSPAPRPLWKSKVEFQRREGTAEHVKDLIAPVWTGTAAPLRGPGEIDVVGHRIVHGGKAFRESTPITPEVKAAIVQLASFAPEHNLLEVEAIETTAELLPGKLQVAVFDTAFHATLPPVAYTYPGPFGWLEEGIRRYGFHGISHQYCSRRAAEMLGHGAAVRRMITCHLGNGCSLAAIRNGESIGTTMGFTPLDGLMMGTRSGSVDPGILIHLVRHCGYSAEDLDRILNKESGLKGISGRSGDLREVLVATDAGDERAKLAFDLFVHRLAAGICSLLPGLSGLDALVFAGGIGENAARVRAETCRALSFLGLVLDEDRNGTDLREDTEISALGSAIRVLVVQTQEEWEIARECRRVKARQSATPSR